MKRSLQSKLLAATRTRIRGFERTGRVGYLLDEVALNDARSLLDMACHSQGDLVCTDGDVPGVVGRLYYLRYEVLGPLLGVRDLTAAIGAFAHVGRDGIDDVPERLRPAVQVLARQNKLDTGEKRTQASHAAIELCQLGSYAESAELISLAIEILNLLVSASSDESERGIYLCNLGNALRSKFEQGGAEADLGRAVTALREALRSTPADDESSRSLFLSNLGVTLRARFECHGRIADLDDAVDALRGAVRLAPAGSGPRAGMLSNFGNALRARFELVGAAADLDEAVDAHREAALLASADDPHIGVYLNNLANSLRVRFGRDRTISDIDAAVDLSRQAIAHTPRENPYCRRYMNNLGISLETRFEETGDIAELDKAVDVLSQAVDETPSDDPHRGMYLSNLGNALRVRYSQEGALADLDTAVAVCTQALETTSPEYFDRAGFLSNLAGALEARFGKTGQIGDIEAAAEALDEAVRLVPIDLPDGGKFLSNLGNALRIQFEATNDAGLGLRAMELFREVAEAGTVPVVRRIACARWWGEMASSLGRGSEALDGYTAAVELLPLVVWKGLSRHDRIHALESLAGLPGDAAATALEADQVDRAVLLLEQARGVLFAQTLEARTYLADLDAFAPDLAPRMRQIRLQLDSADPVDISSFVKPSGTEAAVEDWGRRRRSLAEEWGQLLSEARQRPGLADFLRPPVLADPRTAASHGPVIIANMSRYRCDAVIVSRDGLRVVPLPSLNREAAVGQINIMLEAVDPEVDSPDGALDGVLEWMWDVVVAPVLGALRIEPLHLPEDEAWPRMWWCPTGELSFLPLHAAGRGSPAGAFEPEPAEMLFDSIVSSYTPTLRALISSRKARTDAMSPDEVLVVGLSDTPMLPELRKVESEVRLLERLTGCTVLRNEQATKERFLSELPGKSWLHFAGHGSQDLRDSATGALYCYDHVTAGPVSVSDLMGIDTSDARLAFLSACETARGAVRLPDEAAHIAGALQMAGFVHVIATRWIVADSVALRVARHFYEQLLTSGDPRHLDASRAAIVLHATIRYLRDTRGLSPAHWASYMHVGP